jgi:hypothetical protein
MLRWIVADCILRVVCRCPSGDSHPSLTQCEGSITGPQYYLFTGSIARKMRRARNFSNKYLRTSSVRKLSLLLVEHIWTIDLLVVFVLLRDSAHNFLQQLINNHDGYDQDVGG